MSLLLQRLLYPYLAPNGDDTGNDTSAGGGDDGGDGEDTLEGGAGSVEIIDQGDEDDDTVEGGAPKIDPKAPVEDQMLQGIKGALKEPIETDSKGAAPRSEKAELDALSKVDTSKMSATEKADHDVKLKAAQAAADAAEKVRQGATAKAEQDRKDALLKKDLKEFNLTPEEKRALHSKTNQRMRELHEVATLHKAEHERLAEVNKQLEQARESIVGLLEEHQCTSEDLGFLLDLNVAMKSNPKQALELLNAARESLMEELGVEGEGVDLLKGHPDLSERVKLGELDRKDALEIAASRRRAQADERGREETQREQQERERQEQAQQKALGDIDTWSKKMKTSDVDYDKKAEKIGPAIRDIVKKYPPHLWLETIQGRYDAITIVKEKTATPPDSGLRPSGAKGGAKEFKELSPEALAAGLGYTSLPR